MDFGPPQWIAVCFLDILIKAAVLTLIGAFVTFGMVSPLLYMAFAIPVSLLHFVCLGFAAILMSMFDLLRLRFSGTVHFALFLLIANVLFVVGWAAVFGLGHRPGEIRPGFSDELVTGACLAITNILSILIVAGCSRCLRRAR